MTDKANALVVTLERDIREDDVQPLVDAIKQMRGVASVDLNIADMNEHVANMRVRLDLREKLFRVLEQP